MAISPSETWKATEEGVVWEWGEMMPCLIDSRMVEFKSERYRVVFESSCWWGCIDHGWISLLTFIWELIAITRYRLHDYDGRREYGKVCKIMHLNAVILPLRWLTLSEVWDEIHSLYDMCVIASEFLIVITGCWKMNLWLRHAIIDLTTTQIIPLFHLTHHYSILCFARLRCCSSHAPQHKNPNAPCRRSDRKMSGQSQAG